MEPLSAAAAISAIAGKAWELGSFIREICQGAKTVDGKVRRLESGVNELARACEQVQGQFESMASGPSSENPELAWDEQGLLTASIESQVKDCRKTLKELRKLVVDLRPGSFSFFGRTSRHIKLQDRGQQINEFRVRIKTHTDALQMSLQIVIIKIALATPDFLLRQLGVALEDLRQRLSRIEKNVSPSLSQAVSGEPHGIPLLEHAREALRCGTTLYEGSMSGSVADAAFATDNERAARIRDWNNNVDALRGSNDNIAGVYRPSAMPAHVSAKDDCYDAAAESSRDTLSPHTSPFHLTPEPPTQRFSDKPSSTTCTEGSLHPKSTTKTAEPDGTIHQSGAPGQDTPILANPFQEKVERVLFRYPMHNSQPLDRFTRECLVKSFELEIQGDLETLLCAGEKIGPARLTGLVTSDQAASTTGASATSSETQQRRRDLALLLAVLFRDVYLIKPLVKLGFSPDAVVRPGHFGDAMRFYTPMEAAMAIRCVPIIQECLDAAPGMCFDRWTSPWLGLLNSRNLDHFPVTSLESIERIIDLLMPVKSLKPSACDRTHNTKDEDGTCQYWKGCLLRDARWLPDEYWLPVVTYLLRYFVSDDRSSRHVSNSPLHNAITMGASPTFGVLLERADERLVQTWLQEKDNSGCSLLELAIELVRGPTNRPTYIVQMLLERGADLDARPARFDYRHTRKNSMTLCDLALESNRADLKALVELYSQRLPGSAPLCSSSRFICTEKQVFRFHSYNEIWI